MKRHRALVSLSHDHHRALVEARRLRGVVERSDLSAGAATFLDFFANETVRHFREEEDLVFPTVVDFAEAREPIVQALLEHQRLRARAALLRHRPNGGSEMAEIMRDLGELLEAHIRHEERSLFPLIEALLDETALAQIELSLSDSCAVDGPGETLFDPCRSDPEGSDATFLFWGSGGGSRCDAGFLGDRRRSVRET